MCLKFQGSDGSVQTGGEVNIYIAVQSQASAPPVMSNKVVQIFPSNRYHQKNPSVKTSAFVCHTYSSLISSPEDTDEVDIRASVTATMILRGGSFSGL